MKAPDKVLTGSDRAIASRRYAEAELTARFHSYTEVALHDWQTYCELALLAKERLGLSVQQPDLPGLVVDPGLDLMDVLAKLGVFASSYAFSLVNQIFIQRVAADLGTKHLMTLGLPQIVNALRRHGCGLAEHVVHTAYQLLARQFSVLCQWLCQDQVKSRLAKELRMLAEGSQEGNIGGYPFSQAESLTSDLRRLGATADGSTYLDHLRRLVTEMGNGMALVRLVQQGKARFAANAEQYLRQERGQATPKFSYLADDDHTSSALKEAAGVLQAAADLVTAEPGGGPDYYKVLVRVFSEQMQPQEANLSCFHVAAPALTLNGVEAALLAKEQLPHYRQLSATATFTDDGFPLGLAFLLKVLRQEDQFLAMRWFENVGQHFSRQLADLEAGEPQAGGAFSRLLGKVAGTPPPDPQAQNRELARARLKTYAAEFKLLENTVTSAKLVLARK